MFRAIDRWSVDKKRSQKIQPAVLASRGEFGL